MAANEADYASVSPVDNQFAGQSRPVGGIVSSERCAGRQNFPLYGNTNQADSGRSRMRGETDPGDERDECAGNFKNKHGRCCAASFR